jgi:AcrR family transcriptional regulator
MTSDLTGDAALPRVLEMLWREAPPRRSRGLSRDRIVAAAIEHADADGLAGLSMARLAERLGCGTMSLYRHVASKDELVILMLSTAPGPPPPPKDRDWRRALTEWAIALWDVYHRHPWILPAASAGPPADPGQLAWLEAGLSALGSTGLAERDKLSAVISLLHYVRGAAALDIEASAAGGVITPSHYSDLLTRLLDPERFPAIAAALRAGAFDADADDDPRGDFLPGVRRVLDGIELQAKRSRVK